MESSLLNSCRGVFVVLAVEFVSWILCCVIFVVESSFVTSCCGLCSCICCGICVAEFL